MRRIGLLCAVIASITAAGCGAVMDDLSTEAPEPTIGANGEPGGASNGDRAGSSNASTDPLRAEPGEQTKTQPAQTNVKPSCATVELAPKAAALAGTGRDWTKPTSALTPDGDLAEVTIQGVDESKELVVSAFGAAVPADATIQGVVLDVERGGGSCVLTKKLALVASGIERSAPNVLDQPWQTGTSFGSVSDTWGGLSPAQINDAAFAVVMKVASSTSTGCTNARAGRVDAVRVHVTYCRPGGA